MHRKISLTVSDAEKYAEFNDKIMSFKNFPKSEADDVTC